MWKPCPDKHKPIRAWGSASRVRCLNCGALGLKVDEGIRWCECPKCGGPTARKDKQCSKCLMEEEG